MKPIYFLWGTLGITAICVAGIFSIYKWCDGSVAAIAAGTIVAACSPTIVSFVGAMCSIKNGQKLDHQHVCIEKRAGETVEETKKTAKVAIDAKDEILKAIADPASVSIPAR